ncbi:FdtA/QdtA family cupin domain-containing protein [Enterovibrio sp. ZSDZ42]|uniref:FdtA/QdtA family cupin domain-containing protein n=1 Tax=Enterovibrio gelatinilyticus TaxID=2899819 RepID=A0ABT5QWJ6_9GAMM|nr:FdtA/QdtA family cupin domain-containing protein [Enterovibrio sp. ZSDZ42]MDD1792388.1 FdtA/QdtA family cupin domain-containing protein [Enterovibrio sp. ZSDZ42]
MSFVNIIKFKTLGDERGQLVSLESNGNIPFEIKRTYYIYDTSPGVPRGYHAHFTLRQTAVCLKGSCVVLMDNGIEKVEVTLDSPTKGLMIEPMQWHEMYDFTNDCILMVLASDNYDELDYIRDYDDFVGAVKNDDT